MLQCTQVYQNGTFVRSSRASGWNEIATGDTPDLRFEPWYASPSPLGSCFMMTHKARGRYTSAASGPKSMVILLDRSDSTASTRYGPIEQTLRQAAEMLVHSLDSSDHVAVLTVPSFRGCRRCDGGI